MALLQTVFSKTILLLLVVVLLFITKMAKLKKLAILFSKVISLKKAMVQLSLTVDLLLQILSSAMFNSLITKPKMVVAAPSLRVV